jgi:pimeloyl-ACP methyl ester carboxylesterase
MRARHAALVLAVGAALLLAKARRRRPGDAVRGSFANGMEYIAIGGGPKRMLFIMGGPGSAVPSEREARMMAGSVAPYLADGYTVWAVTRRRGMPAGATVADMAVDYAEVIENDLGGRVDVVVAEELGGMIGQQLAADRPDLIGCLVLVRTAWRVTQWGEDADGRFGEALSAGRYAEAGATALEEVVPEARWTWLRRLLGPLLGRWLAGRDYNLPDVLVETRAERAFDGREVLPRISVPVLLIAGTNDRVFAKDDVEETARLIPDCTLTEYEGVNGLRTASSSRVPRDVLAFIHQVTPTPKGAMTDHSRVTG